MKIVMSFILFLVSLNLFAQTRSCEMSSGRNKTQIKLISNASGVLVQLSEEEPDLCELEESSDFELLARCGSEDDATFFGVKGSSGKVFEGSSTIALLRKCKFIQLALIELLQRDKKAGTSPAF